MGMRTRGGGDGTYKGKKNTANKEHTKRTKTRSYQGTKAYRENKDRIISGEQDIQREQRQDHTRRTRHTKRTKTGSYRGNKIRHTNRTKTGVYEADKAYKESKDRIISGEQEQGIQRYKEKRQDHVRRTRTRHNKENKDKIMSGGAHQASFKKKKQVRAQELCERRGGRPGLPVPNSPYGLCGRKVTLNQRAAQSSGAV